MRPIIIIFLPLSLPLPLSITRFYILFEQTISRASLLALAISIYFSCTIRGQQSAEQYVSLFFLKFPL